MQNNFIKLCNKFCFKEFLSSLNRYLGSIRLRKNVNLGEVIQNLKTKIFEAVHGDRQKWLKEETTNLTSQTKVRLVTMFYEEP
mgnify:CR=1 FL=1